MIFFDIAPGGALVNALEAAAESERTARRQQPPAPSKPKTRQVPSEGMLTQFRTFFAPPQKRRSAIG
jgi:hypothetical protein